MQYKLIKILSYFLFSNLLAYALLLITPIVPLESNFLFLSVLNLVFILCVLFFSVFGYKSILLFCNSSNLGIPMTKSQLRFNVILTSFGSVSGFLLIFYDRVFIRGINYSEGLRGARYQWLASEGGSFYSVLGNLLIPFSYLCIFILLIHHRSLTRFNVFILSVSAIIGVGGHAALNGGRSNILLAVIMVFCILLVREQRTYITKKKSIFGVFVCLFLIISVVAFSINVTNSSAEMGGVSIGELMVLGVDSLYGKVDESSILFLQEAPDFYYFMIYAIAYLFHGQWTAQYSYSLPIRDGSYALYPFSVILERIGILDETLEVGKFSDTGAFISLPGAFYYDFGFAGVVIMASLLGLMLGVASFWVIRGRYVGGVKMAFIIYTLYLALLSPVMPAYGFAYLNFIVYAFVVAGVVNLFVFNRKCNWLKALDR